jgi:hypothetical protein
VIKENVAQFYFPKGKPIPKEVKEQTELAIQKAFEGKADNCIKLEDFETICTDVC